MIKVLLVDDEPLIRQGLKIIVDWEEYGYEIAAEAGNGMEAIEILESQHIDLVFADLKMPGMSGLELIDYVQKQIPGLIRFVILTGYSDFEYIKTAIRLKVVDYMLKPVQQEELIRILTDMNRAYKKDREQETREKIRDQMEYELHVSHILLEKYTHEEIQFVKERLSSSDSWNYVSFEFDQNQNDFQELEQEEKVQLQKTGMDYLKELVSENPYHVIPILEPEEHIFGAALLYVPRLAAKRQMAQEAYITYLHKRLNQHFTYRLQVYIGANADSLEQIGESYQSIRVARCLHSLAGEHRSVTAYEEAKKRKMAVGVEKTDVDELIVCVRNNEEAPIASAVDVIFMQIRKKDMNPDMIYASIYYILYRLIELVKEFDDESNQQEVLDYISSESFDKIVMSGNAEELTRFVLDYAGYLYQVRSTEKRGSLLKVEAYIQEHYEENLSLKSLGEMFNFNNVYLGQLLKKEYGMSFKEYMSELRIQKAVKLLETTDLRIYAVAEQVGFHNVEYFISKFVQVKGITPHQYRIKSKQA